MSLLKITAALLLLGFSSLFAAEGPMRIYPKRFDPADHPDHGRYAVTPPDWNSFGGKTQFICCRGFPSVTDPQTGLRKGVDFDKTYLGSSSGRTSRASISKIWTSSHGGRKKTIFSSSTSPDTCREAARTEAETGCRAGRAAKNSIFLNRSSGPCGSEWTTANRTDGISAVTRRT